MIYILHKSCSSNSFVVTEYEHAGVFKAFKKYVASASWISDPFAVMPNAIADGVSDDDTLVSPSTCQLASKLLS